MHRGSSFLRFALSSIEERAEVLEGPEVSPFKLDYAEPISAR